MRHTRILVGIHPLVFFLAASCGDSTSHSPDAATDAAPDAATTSSFNVGVVVKAVNYSVTPQLFVPALIATNTNNGAPDGIPSLGILSGPPTDMRVYLQSIALTRDNDASTTAVYSSTATHTTDSGVEVTGCQLSLTSGNLDLSVCPGLDQLSIPAGTYTGMAVTFARVGEIAGCMNGKFANVTSSVATSGTYTYPPPFPQTPVSYTTDAVTPSTLYTFCTRKDKYYYQAETASQTTIGSDADFDATNAYFTGQSTPDFVTIDLLGGNNGQAQTMAQLEAGSVTLTSTTVPTSASPTLTLAVDMNRIFGFFANVRSDFNPPDPTAHTGTSYFFTTKFGPVGGPGATSAVTAHAGALTAQGYQWTATPTAGGQAAAAGWYTLFLDASENYVGGTMYQDDDNGLTILKGNVTITSGSLAAGATLTLHLGTCTGFTTTALNGTGTCSLTGNSQTYNVAYTRLL